MKGGLFQDELFKNPKNDQPWMKSETDRMLDLYFGGTPPDRVAYLLKRNPKAVKRRIEQFTYNEDGRAERYDPFRRESRQGRRVTENERLLIKAHAKRDVPIKATANVLQRKVEEIDSRKKMDDAVAKAAAKEFKRVALSTEVELCLAHRFLYYVVKSPIISDETYDDLKKEAMEYAGGHGALSEPASDRQDDYDYYIQCLANYLMYRPNSAFHQKNHNLYLSGYKDKTDYTKKKK